MLVNDPSVPSADYARFDLQSWQCDLTFQVHIGDGEVKLITGVPLTPKAHQGAQEQRYHMPIKVTSGIFFPANDPDGGFQVFILEGCGSNVSLGIHFAKPETIPGCLDIVNNSYFLRFEVE